MSSDLNPFEPWRPRGSGPSDDVVHPWRASRAGGHQPVDELELAEEAAPRRPPTTANSLLVLLFLVLALAGLGSLGSLGGRHAPRIAAVCGTLFLGTMLGMSVMHLSRWRVRVGVCAASCAASLVCYYFVPTTNGLNLWAANAGVAALERLAPGDFAGFSALRPRIDEVRQEFKLLTLDVQRAESAWVKRTADAAIQEVTALQVTGAEAALDRLLALEGALTAVGQLPAVRSQLQRAYRGVADARLDQLDAEAAKLTARGLFRGAQELLADQGQALTDKVGDRIDTLALQDRLKGMRRAVLRRHLDEGKKLLARLAAERQWDAVGREARRLHADLANPAAALGEAAAVREILDGPRRDAVRRGLDEAIAAARTKLEAGEFDEPDRIARRTVEALAGEAQALDLDGDLMKQFLPVRRDALRARIKRAGEALQEALDKKDYAAVAAKGADLQARLAGPARELGEAGRLEDALMPPRRAALAARLDAAREEVAALLVKDRYEEIGKAGRRAAEQLGPEAELLGRQEALAAFVDRCKVLARLAELAGKK